MSNLPSLPQQVPDATLRRQHFLRVLILSHLPCPVSPNMCHTQPRGQYCLYMLTASLLTSQPSRIRRLALLRRKHRHFQKNSSGSEALGSPTTWTYVPPRGFMMEGEVQTWRFNSRSPTTDSNGCSFDSPSDKPSSDASSKHVDHTITASRSKSISFDIQHTKPAVAQTITARSNSLSLLMTNKISASNAPSTSVAPSACRSKAQIPVSSPIDGKAPVVRTGPSISRGMKLTSDAAVFLKAHDQRKPGHHSIDKKYVSSYVSLLNGTDSREQYFDAE